MLNISTPCQLLFFFLHKNHIYCHVYYVYLEFHKLKAFQGLGAKGGWGCRGVCQIWPICTPTNKGFLHCCIVSHLSAISCKHSSLFTCFFALIICAYSFSASYFTLCKNCVTKYIMVLLLNYEPKLSYKPCTCQ